MMRLRRFLCLLSVVLSACSIFEEDNGAYCGADRPCADATKTCNMTLHQCEGPSTPPPPSPTDPSIISIVPAAVTRVGGVSITITGNNFEKVSEVLFAGVPGTGFLFNSITKTIQVTVPAATAPNSCGLTQVTLRTTDNRDFNDSTHFRYKAGIGFGGSDSMGMFASTTQAIVPINLTGGRVDDLAVSYNTTLGGYQNNGVGDFTMSLATLNLLANIQKMIPAKINNDDLPDLMGSDLLSSLSPIVNTGNRMLSGLPPANSNHTDFDVGRLTAAAQVNQVDDLAILYNSSAMGQAFFSIMENNGSGMFTQNIQSAIGSGMYSKIAVGDFNEDGYGDVAAISHLASPLVVLINNKNYGVSTNDPYTNLDVIPDLLSVADMDLDGHLDIVLAGNGTASAVGVQILYGDGKGKFTPTPIIFTPGTPTIVKIADFDCDQLLDLIVYEPSGKSVSFYGNNGGRAFSQRIDIPNPNGYPTKFLAVGQLQNDIFPDLIFGRTAGGNTLFDVMNNASF